MLIIFHYSAELPQMLKGGGCLGCMEISFPPGTRGAGCCHYTQMSFPLLASSSNLSTTLSRNEAAWAQQGCREKRRRAGCCPGLQTVFLARPPLPIPPAQGKAPGGAPSLEMRGRAAERGPDGGRLARPQVSVGGRTGKVGRADGRGLPAEASGPGLLEDIRCGVQVGVMRRQRGPPKGTPASWGASGSVRRVTGTAGGC